MKERCCGKLRDSKYCPECGKRLGVGPLGRLLDHLKSRATSYEKEATTIAARTDIDQSVKDRVHNHAAKWREWVNAMEELLNKTEAEEKR